MPLMGTVSLGLNVVCAYFYRTAALRLKRGSYKAIRLFISVVVERFDSYLRHKLGDGPNMIEMV